jgi:hypothetical protein
LPEDEDEFAGLGSLSAGFLHQDSLESLFEDEDDDNDTSGSNSGSASPSGSAASSPGHESLDGLRRNGAVAAVGAGGHSRSSRPSSAASWLVASMVGRASSREAVDTAGNVVLNNFCRFMLWRKRSEECERDWLRGGVSGAGKGVAED